MPKRAKVGDVKSDIERGPFGAWAFHARDQLDVTVEAVAGMLNYHPASLRKMESGSAPPSRRMRRELPDLYARLAAEKGVVLTSAPGDDAPPAPTDYLAVLTRIADEVALMRVAQEETAAHLAAILGAVEHPPREGTPAADAGATPAGTR